VALTYDQIKEAVTEHMRAEQEQDWEFLTDQLDDDVEYALNTVWSPEDPEPYGGHFVGTKTYLELWHAVYRNFESYDIEIEDVVIEVERRMAFVRLQVTAVPKQEWYGLPAGRPVRWRSAAICVFDEDGHMLSENAYGSFPPIMEGYRRAVEYTGAG
jgi:predicted ester cyclase